MSYTLRGNLASAADLPFTGNRLGDSYLIGGHLCIWDGSSWIDVGSPSGPKGISGAVGMPGNYVKRLKDIDLTYKGVKVTISSYDDVSELFLDPDDLQRDDLAIFETTYPEQYAGFRDKWARERAIQIATAEVEEWRKDYEKDERRDNP